MTPKLEKTCKTCKHESAGMCNNPQCDGDMDGWEPIDTLGIPELKESSPYDSQVGGDHYRKRYPFCQPLEFFSKNNISFTKANVCKYVLRHNDKNGIEDLRKAKHYLEVMAHDEYGIAL